MEHTKGKWTIRYENNLTAIVTLSGEMQLSLFSSKLNPPLNCDLQEWEANARLIAAAPDLLDACKKAAGYVLACVDPTSWAGRVYEEITDAIAKAESEA